MAVGPTGRQNFPTLCSQVVDGAVAHRTEECHFQTTKSPLLHPPCDLCPLGGDLRGHVVKGQHQKLEGAYVLERLRGTQP